MTYIFYKNREDSVTESTEKLSKEVFFLYAVSIFLNISFAFFLLVLIDRIAAIIGDIELIMYLTIGGFFLVIMIIHNRLSHAVMRSIDDDKPCHSLFAVFGLILYCSIIIALIDPLLDLGILVF